MQGSVYTRAGNEISNDEGGERDPEPVVEIAPLWEQAAEKLRARLSEGSFTTWFGRCRAVGLDGDSFVLAVPSHFTKEWIEGRYLEDIHAVVGEATGKALAIALVIDPSLAEQETEAESSTAPAAAPSSPVSGQGGHHEVPRFHPKYTFDSFVIGSSNRFAHAACLAVGEAPAESYNPLFIYGEAGLGKTHLLHAIGHYVRQTSPGSVVRYVSTEQFTNDFIIAVQSRSIPEFHRRYRVADLLLIDDIQFLEGKERTQEEFFHTFNALHPKSQVVITSDRPPKKIQTLEERLRTRFEWGLITDIQPPDLETRLAILQKKAMTERLDVPAEVMSFIASRIQTNIRELEGALIRVVAYSSLTRSEISLELAQNVLQSLLPDGHEARVTADLVISVAADYFDVTPEEICSSSRSRPLVTARQIAMYICRELTDLSLPNIGKKFGGRDHSTVIYANNKIRELMHDRQSAFDQVKELTTRVRQQAARG
ncbi:MAG: chromosomal replication initiator protein DnaA [Actinomycetota bacterium]